MSDGGAANSAETGYSMDHRRHGPSEVQDSEISQNTNQDFKLIQRPTLHTAGLTVHGHIEMYFIMYSNISKDATMNSPSSHECWTS